MSRLLEEAIVKVRRLPEAEQDRAAEFLLGLAETRESALRLTDEHVAEVELARREARDGALATDEEMTALWRRFGA